MLNFMLNLSLRRFGRENIRLAAARGATIRDRDGLGDNGTAWERVGLDLTGSLGKDGTEPLEKERDGLGNIRDGCRLRSIFKDKGREVSVHSSVAEGSSRGCL